LQSSGCEEVESTLIGGKMLCLGSVVYSRLYMDEVAVVIVGISARWDKQSAGRISVDLSCGRLTVGEDVSSFFDDSRFGLVCMGLGVGLLGGAGCWEQKHGLG
jgi:hypothetical protein